MKATTTIVIIAAVLSLQVSTLFAGNGNLPLRGSADATPSYTVSLAPSTPAEATFDEETVATDYTYLAPATPTEATFEEMPSDLTAPVNLTPVTPAEAGFEEEGDAPPADLRSLAPVTPAEADFE